MNVVLPMCGLDAGRMIRRVSSDASASALDIVHDTYSFARKYISRHDVSSDLSFTLGP